MLLLSPIFQASENNTLEELIEDLASPGIGVALGERQLFSFESRTGCGRL
jgi:hypothetical protein